MDDTFEVSEFNEYNNWISFPITIEEPNEPPTICSNTFATELNVPLDAELCADDAEDPDALTFSATTLPAHGVLSLEANGTFTYTPDTGYLGLDSFDFVVTDPDDATATGTASITVFDPDPGWIFVGFDNPWAPGYIANAGSSIPLKWHYVDRVTGDVVDSSTDGLQVRIEGYPNAFPAPGESCGTGVPPLERVEDSGSSDLRYVNGDWQINWDTVNLPVGCYQLSIYHPFTHQLDSTSDQGELLTIVLQ